MQRIVELGWPETRDEAKLDVYEIPVGVHCEFDRVGVNVAVFKLEQEFIYGLVRDSDSVITKALGFNNTYLIRLDDKTFGVMKGAINRDEYYVFDPHACGIFGETSPEGNFANFLFSCS